MLSILEEPKKISNKGFDKYYTPKAVAVECLDVVKKYVEKIEITPSEWVEPAAGAGSFFNLMPDNKTGLDVVPYCDGAIQDDFFETEYQFKQGSVCVTNPPFGFNNSTAIKFFNKAAEFSDIIGFVVSTAWQLKSIRQRIKNGWILVYSKDFGGVDFIDPNKKSIAIPVLFQVWVSPKYKNKVTDISHTLKSDSSFSSLSFKYPAVPLGDIVTEVNRSVILKDDDICREPGITAAHRIVLRSEKQGLDIKIKTRKIISPGDLVFAMLHTQKGLFAFSEDTFHATSSRLVCVVNTNKVRKSYLYTALDYLIPKLKPPAGQVVARETYKKEDIFAIPIPLPTPEEQLEIIPELSLMNELRNELEALTLKMNRCEFVVKESFLNKIIN